MRQKGVRTIFSSPRRLNDPVLGKNSSDPFLPFLPFLPFPRIAAIGPGTAGELACYGWHADLVPEQFRAEGLAEALECEAAGRRFLLARASRGRELLAERLVAAGAVVEQVVCYTSTDVERPTAIPRRCSATERSIGSRSPAPPSRVRWPDCLATTSAAPV